MVQRATNEQIRAEQFCARKKLASTGCVRSLCFRTRRLLGWQIPPKTPDCASWQMHSAA